MKTAQTDNETCRKGTYLSTATSARGKETCTLQNLACLSIPERLQSLQVEVFVHVVADAQALLECMRTWQQSRCNPESTQSARISKLFEPFLITPNAKPIPFHADRREKTFVVSLLMPSTTQRQSIQEHPSRRSTGYSPPRQQWAAKSVSPPIKRPNKRFHSHEYCETHAAVIVQGNAAAGKVTLLLCCSVLCARRPLLEPIEALWS